MYRIFFFFLKQTGVVLFSGLYGTYIRVALNFEKTSGKMQGFLKITTKEDF